MGEGEGQRWREGDARGRGSREEWRIGGGRGGKDLETGGIEGGEKEKGCLILLAEEYNIIFL